MAASNQGEARSPLAALRRAIDDFRVEEEELERRLEWPAGELARMLDDRRAREEDKDGENVDPAPYRRIWIALLVLALERWAGRDTADRPYPFDPSNSYVHQSAGEYEAFETDRDPADEVGLTPSGPPSLEQTSLAMSRELTGVLLDLMHRLYQAGEGERIEPFDRFIQIVWQLIEERGKA